MSWIRSLIAVLVTTVVGCGAPTEVSNRTEPVEEATEVEDRPSTPAPPKGPLPTFVEVAGDWGLDFERYDDQRGQHRIVEVNGGGVAVFDFDLDGLPDLAFTNGCRVPEIAGPRTPSVLLRNTGVGKPDYEDVAALAHFEQFGYAHGCAVGDFNGDGFPDLAITAYGANRLWENNGDGTFSAVPLPEPNRAWSSSVAFGDLDGDGLLDLYCVNYVDAAVDPPRLCPNPAHPDGYLHCPPTVFDAVRDVLLHNDGEGGFEDATEGAGIEQSDGKGLGVTILDVDRDGRLDVYVANDGMPNHLYLGRRSEEGNTSFFFDEQGLEFGVALNRNGEAEASMGVATGDVDRNGWTDLFVSHFFAETNTLYANVDGEYFTDSTTTSRLGPPSLRYLGFGTAFLDWDNDGWLDLVVANGHVDDFEQIDPLEPYAMRPQAFRNERNGRFLEVSDWAGPAFVERRVGRGLATGDLDRDGRVDVVISNQGSPSKILRNETVDPHPSISIRLVGTGRSPRTPVGARVTVELDDGSQFHDLVGGGSYQSASEQRVHVGLGSSKRARRLQVEWPNSAGVDEFEDVGPGRYLLVRGGTLLGEP